MSITRKIDELGRFVLPVETRKSLGIDEKVELRISVDGNKIILEKTIQSCFVCGSEEDLLENNGRHLCSICLGKFEVSYSQTN